MYEKDKRSREGIKAREVGRLERRLQSRKRKRRETKRSPNSKGSAEIRLNDRSSDVRDILRAHT